MSFVINLTDCSSGSKICGATLGNGSCYSESNGVYTFASCEQLAACAGNKYAKVSVAPTTVIPASGGSRTFGVYYYGLSSAANATKSGSWSGTVSCPASTCPNLVQISLSAGVNTSTSPKTYTVSFSGSTASISQCGATQSYGVYFPDYVVLESSEQSRVYDLYVQITVGSITYATYSYQCGTGAGGAYAYRDGSQSTAYSGSANVTVNVELSSGNTMTQDCSKGVNSGGVYIDNGHSSTTACFGSGSASWTFTASGQDYYLDITIMPEETC